MTRARKELVSLMDTTYYHVVGRCVRRGWLCGFDEYAQRDYSHRRQWVIDRLLQLDQIFTIDVCSYSIMSNHYHLGLHIDQGRAAALSRAEVVDRWTRLFAGPALIQRWRRNEGTAAERAAAELIIDQWRCRLFDLSWFMKSLNEHIARKANEEDGCTGHFWEGRFKSQALRDETALLAAMVYVDLNPIRAGVADTPEASDFTSVQQRIHQHRVRTDDTAQNRAAVAVTPAQKEKSSRLRLMPCLDEASTETTRLPIKLRDYLELVDWSGRTIKPDKRGFIDSQQPPILQRLNIDPDAWRSVIDRSRGPLTRIGALNHQSLHAKPLGNAP